MTLTVGSLFSGIGGLDLGLERAGMRVIWQSEIDPYACRVLKKHWPEVVNHGNIKEINWQEVERPDVICGGYPCQPFSTAGKRRGEEDPRHLWPWVREAISELRPSYAILENVRGHLSMGGLTVISELASIGYDAEWRVVSAASVGANHRRDRVIIVAYPNSQRPYRAEVDTTETRLDAFGQFARRGSNVADTDSASRQQQHKRQVCEPDIGGRSENVAYPDSSGMERQRPEQQTTRPSGNGEEMADTTGEGLQGLERTVFEGIRERFTYSGGEWWQVEPDMGRVAHGIPNRVDRLRGLGNAVVPQVAEVIGRLVMEHAR